MTDFEGEGLHRDAYRAFESILVTNKEHTRQIRDKIAESNDGDFLKSYEALGISEQLFRQLIRARNITDRRGLLSYLDGRIKEVAKPPKRWWNSH